MYSKGQNVLLDGVRPLSQSMEEDGAGPLSNGAYKVLSSSIFLVSIDCAKGELLLLFEAQLLKQFGGVHTIICPCVFDVNTKMSGEFFEF